jgi:hypothetical protein
MLAAMKTVMLALCFVLVSVAKPALPSAAQNDESPISIHGPTTEQLLAYCSGVDKMDTKSNMAPSQDVSSLSYCFGYITGVIDTTATFKAVSQTRTQGYCIPENATATQLAKVFVKYANAHPEELHYGGLITIALAFNQSFPCHTP